MKKQTNLLLLILLLSTNIQAKFLQEAFGHPGLRANWGSASNVQVGTFFEKAGSIKSPLWFTNAKGTLTEVFYPTIDQGQIKDSQILISDGKSLFTDEKSLIQEVEVLNDSQVKLINRDKENKFEISHVFFTDGNRPILIDEITITANVDDLSFYLLTNPHLKNTGARDSAYVDNEGFVVKEDDISLSIRSTTGFSKKSVGFVGFSDGWQDLKKDYKMNFEFSSASEGNVATMGELKIPSKKGKYKFYVIYEFDVNGRFSILKDNYQSAKKSYSTHWGAYLSTLKKPTFRNNAEKDLYYRSLYTLKVHEDKINPGALIASLSIPWGETQYETGANKIGGYHLIWPRDLYHVATALLLSGDFATAERALGFLSKIQYTSHDGNWNLNPRTIQKEGAFPQNTWVTGEDYWGGFQLDQVGYPVHLFYQLYTKSNESKKRELLNKFSPMITKALKFIQKNGPWTQQERWEENFGISPSSFSVATSALILGSKIFNNEFGQKLYETANQWLTKPGDNIDTWTFTTTGYHGDGKYYLRVAGGDNYGSVWDPNNRAMTHIANSPMKKEQSKIMDQGFLKLALMGLKPASDPKLLNSKLILDQQVSVVTPNGRGWYRYSFDSYGEEHKGRLWPLLSGEHARFAIERFKAQDLSWESAKVDVNNTLDSYLGFANNGNMLPEQVYESTGEGTGAATPLAWSHAEYIKLLWSKNQRHNVENLLN